METSTTSETETPKPISVRSKKNKQLTIALVIAVIVVLLAVAYSKGLIVAATVNGNPISRIAVIQELEKQGGQQVLQSLIGKKVLEDELDKKNITVTPAEVDAEMKKVEAQVTSQGGTLDQALAAQGLTQADLREQVTLQKRLEKLLADKITVSDAEIDSYIKDNNAKAPQGTSDADFRQQISDQLKGQKFQTEASKLVSDLTTNAKIKYYVHY